MFEPIYDEPEGAIIKVIGVGGGGGNALKHMVETYDTESMATNQMGSVEFYAVNTDAQALAMLSSSGVHNTIQIGANLTHGLGAGGNPQVGYEAAKEDENALTNVIDGANMVFIAAGMGGGSGTGAAPVIAELARKQDILTVAIVTKPFRGEGRKRLAYAEQGIRELGKHVDTLIIIQNDKLAKILPKNIKLNESLAYANNVLRNSVLGITEMITKQGIINVDFADVTTVMSQMGRALMGTAEAEGEGRAERVIQEATSSPLLEDIELSGAKGILINIVSNGDIELAEYNYIMDYVENLADKDATIIIGSAEDPTLNGVLRVTVVAAGIGQTSELPATATQRPLGNEPIQTTPVSMERTTTGSGGHFGGNFNEQHIAQPVRPSEPQQPSQPQRFEQSQIFQPGPLHGFMRNGQ